MSNTQTVDFTIRDDFPPVSYEQWREVVDQTLKGAPFDRKLVTRTYEGLDIQPIYSRRDELGADDPLGFPGLTPLVRGSRPLGAAETGWDIRQEFTHPDPGVTADAIAGDVAGGVTSLHVRLDAAARGGLDPDDPSGAPLAGVDGVMAYGVADLDRLFAAAPPGSVAIALDAGAAFLPAAALLASWWSRRGIPGQQAVGAFNADPLATLASEGTLPVPIERAMGLMAELAKWTAEHHPNVTAVGVDTSPYHNAGGTAAQDIAFAAATAVEYLRAMTDAGLSATQAAGQVLYRLSLGTHHFQAIAKLRAARQVFCRVLEACGVASPGDVVRIHSRTADRVLTRHDPHVNLLRNTVAVFAAGVGGADAITSVPFDAAIGLPSEFSRRVARNTVLVLQDEAHLHRVIDPAGGSWFLDQLTEQLAARAWEIFQDVERAGGMLSAIMSGSIAQQIDSAYAPRAADIARRKHGITGVSEFPDISQQRQDAPAPDIVALQRAAAERISGSRKSDIAPDSLSSGDVMSAAVDAATAGATIGQLAAALGFHQGSSQSITPIEARRFAQPFEQLRDACDAWLESHGGRPRVFLANFGPISHHTARATWSSNFFQAGGFQVIGNNGFADAEAAAAAFADSGADVAVICSSDKLYPDVVPAAAAKLKQAGAQCVVLAGHPGDNEAAWSEAGVDRFIFMKCNVLETLRELLRRQGVLQEGETS